MIIVALPLLLVMIGIAYALRGWCFKFDRSVKAGELPASFFVRYFPCVFPFLYALAVTALAWLRIESKGFVLRLFFVTHLHYIGQWAVFAAMSIFGDYDTRMVPNVPLIASGITMLVSFAYLAIRTPSPSKHRLVGSACYTISILVLSGVCMVLYFDMVQTNYTYRDDRVPRVSEFPETPQHHPHRGDRTDLRSYVPFSRNNKLAKMENATLKIAADHPRIDGALALYPIYAAAVQATYENYTEENAGDPTREDSAIKGSPSPPAFQALLDGKADMVFMLRPSEKQLQAASEAGKTLTITPIGREAFVFFVNRRNPVNDLSSEQIRNIYAKKTVRWSEVSGSVSLTNLADRIIPFQRPEGSGSQTAMERFMGEVSLAPPIQEEYQQYMSGIVQRVADYRNYRNAIGYSFRFYATSMFYDENIKLISVDGVAPSVENVQNETYPLSGELCIVTADSQNPHVPEILDWFLTEQGQNLIESTGYVPL